GNYLYRVEIHASGRSPHRRDEREKHAPTFKWSRRNGADTFAIAAVEHRSDTVHLLGLPQGIEPLAPGDLVEVLDDAMPVDGDADALLEVREVRAGGAVLLSGPVPARVAHDASRHPFLRRWDHAPPDDAAGADADDGAIPVHDHWTRLEHGIRVRFEPDRHYTRGDYWWIVARQDLPGGIEWPKRRGEPRHMPPDGVERRVAPLALLDLDGDAIDVIDLRTSVPAAPSRPVVPWPEPALDPPEADDGDGDGERDGESDGDGPEPVPEPAIPYEPEPPPGQPPPTQRFEFAIIGPAGPPPPGFVATGLEVVTRPHWRRVGAVELVAEELQAVASWEGRLLLATAEAIWAFDGAVTRRLTGLAERRHGFAMRIVEGLLMLVGGRGESGGPDGRMFALDMVRLEWSERARMRERVEGAAVAAAEGRVHVIGGHRRRRPTRDHQVFESATGEWTKGPRPSTERSHAVAVVADGHVRVVGGLDRDGRPLSLHEAFGPTGGWHGEGALPRPYHVHAAAVYRDRHAVLVQDPRRPELQHVLTYHSALARWDSLAQLPGGVRPLDLISNAEGFVAVAADSSGGVVIYEMTFLVDWTVFAPDPA
ncbi:MAG: DUF6519 domain-containing protein, partial [Gaiellaceae bacterium]